MQIKNVKVYGLEESIIRSGYPMQVGEPENLENLIDIWQPEMDDAKSISRAIKLANTPVGSGHNNWLKGVIVSFDLQYPEYFSPQLQRYHWIDIVSSQSKMHKITSTNAIEEHCDTFVIQQICDIMNDLIGIYNDFENKKNVEYIASKYSLDFENKSDLFQYIISNLPSGYLKWMGISTNYLQLNFRRAQ